MPDDQYNYDGTFVDQEADLPLAYDPSGNASWDFQFSGIGSLLKNLGLDTSSGNILKSLGSVFTGTSDYGKVGQIAGLGGLAMLMNKLTQRDEKPVGYQGGIPRYTATREQTPLAQQRPEGYRPGQGGISYFTPMQYSYAGFEPKRAQDFIKPVATLGGNTNATIGTNPAVPTETVTPTNPDNQAYSFADGGIAMLAGGGNRFLRGPGDGVSDSIKAKFDQTGQPARLADGEFVIDARTVSELGNGSSEAGARKLYAMMDRVHAARKKAGRGKPSGADRELAKLTRG